MGVEYSNLLIDKEDEDGGRNEDGDNSNALTNGGNSNDLTNGGNSNSNESALACSDLTFAEELNVSNLDAEYEKAVQKSYVKQMV